MSGHKLNLETGRYGSRTGSRHHRICEFCSEKSLIELIVNLPCVDPIIEDLILSYLMRIRCDATRPSNESTTFVILVQHYLHYNVNQHFQGRALQEAEGSFLRPATVKALCHTFFARGFAVLIKHSSSFNPHTRFLEHSAEWTVGLHRPLGILSRASTTLTPRLGR